MTTHHFIGIGGIGMSGLARILLKRGQKISGSDISKSYVIDDLIKAGAEIHIGHEETYVSQNVSVVYSTDIKRDNVEFQQAMRLKCPMLHRSDLLLHLMEGYKPLAIAGTHGKTTTTALLTAVLKEANADPAYAVGGILPQFNTNADHGDGDYFVVEADESDGTFLKYHPYGAIITNIDLDHMNHFGTEANLCRSFRQFALQVKSSKHLFWCGEDRRLCNLKLEGNCYGFGTHCPIRAQNVFQKGWELQFDAFINGENYPKISLNLIGQHNVLNALAVFALCLTLEIPESVIRIAFQSFKGIKRRCEQKGEWNGALIIDDYAHHPTEISTTLAGIKKASEGKRLIAVFQPHRFSRTKDCLGTFGGIFDEVDQLIITDIFAAGEPNISGLTAQNVLEEIKASSPGLRCEYVSRNQLCGALINKLQEGDVMVTLGAGDITKLSAEILSDL